MDTDPFGVHEALGWFAFVAVIAIPYGIAHVRARRRKAAAGQRLLPRGAQGQPVVADVIPPCHVTGCPIPGYVPVVRVAGHRLTAINVCHGHAAEGEAYGWWLREQGWRPVAS